MKPTIQLSFWLTLPFKSPKMSRRARRGQTLIIALAVLFVLLFIGAYFVTQIARNLAAAGRSRETQNAKSFAEAGIKYAKDQLTTSEQGADWRPDPTIPNSLTDPDIQWLREGFTRLPLTGGRCLLRVVYDPHPSDPKSENIRIESVGRSGELGVADDPTVFVQTGNPSRLRSERIAYADLGLFANQMYITNKDRQSREAFIGTPPMQASIPGVDGLGFDPAFIVGDPSLALHTNGINGDQIIIGGGIRSNANIRFGGDTHIYLSPRGTTSNSPYNTSPEGIKTSGSINLLTTRNIDNGGGTDALLNDNDLQTFVNTPFVTDVVGGKNYNSIGGQTPPIANAVRQSEDTNFNSLGGLLRDGSPSSDINGYIRSISREEPPILDTNVSGTSTNRYRATTRDTGYWLGAGNNTGYYGYGTGVYLNNPSDRQAESGGSITGGASLRNEWLNPNSVGTANWSGPFYNPPGILIELLGTTVRFTRSVGSFTKPDGTPLNGANGTSGKVLEMPLADILRQNFALPDGSLYISATGGKTLPKLSHAGDEPGATSLYQDKNSYGVNLVIMAEGNVRVKGFYGGVTDPTVAQESIANPSNPVLKLGRVHITIVSGGSAYIEGNIVKSDGYVSNGKVTLERASSCSIMARDYVVVNTTQFMAPTNGTGAPVSPTDSGFPFTEIGLSTTNFDLGMSFGVPVASYTQGANPAPLHLMVRHAAQSGGVSPVNLFVNPASAPDVPNQASTAAYRFNLPVLPPETYALGVSIDTNGLAIPNPFSVSPEFERIAFPLRNQDGSPRVPTIDGVPGHENIFRFAIDQNVGSLTDPATGQPLFGGGNLDYHLGSAIVAPLDIRIEALLYAQERSFFVIPGYSYNIDPNDTIESYIKTNIRPSYSPGERDYLLNSGNYSAQQSQIFLAGIAAKNRYPFFNQPMDVRITVHGSLSQNFTASSGDQAAWFARWGYVPSQYGGHANRLNANLQDENIPDVHLLGHDPNVNTASLAVNYNPAEDRNNDFRTFLEQKQNISRGLRLTYDPAFAMPYATPTSVALYRDDIAMTSAMKRQIAALRFREVKVGFGDGTLPQIVRQILPPTPNMPVCPDLLYEGEPDRPLVQ